MYVNGTNTKDRFMLETIHLFHEMPSFVIYWRQRGSKRETGRGRDRASPMTQTHDSVLLDVIGLRGSHVNSPARSRVPDTFARPAGEGEGEGALFRGWNLPKNRSVAFGASRADLQEHLGASPPVDLRRIPRSVRGNKGLPLRSPARERWSFVGRVSRTSCVRAYVRAFVLSARM